MLLTIDYLALAIATVFILAALWAQSHFNAHDVRPTFAFSQVLPLPTHSLRMRWASLPNRLKQIGFLCLFLALIDPHFLLPIKPVKSELPPPPIPSEGIAIYLLLDQSGSMSEEVSTSQGKMSKIDLLKQVTTSFIQDHPSDLIGLIFFARVPTIAMPLTLDQGDLLTELSQFHVVTDPNQDGTAMGYAIFKAANLISATRHFAQDLPPDARPTYEIKNSIIIVVTDGLQDPNRLDYGNRLRTIELEDAADYAKSQGIKVYIVNVDPSIAKEEFAPQRRQMQKITELTGGRLFLVDRQTDLQQVYHTIDQLEKEKLPGQLVSRQIQSEYQRFNLFPYLIAAAMVTLILAISLECLVIKRVP